MGQDGLPAFEAAEFGLAAAESWGSVGGGERGVDAIGIGEEDVAEGNAVLSYNSLYSQLNAELERDSKGLMLLKSQNSAVRNS